MRIGTVSDSWRLLGEFSCVHFSQWSDCKGIEILKRERKSQGGAGTIAASISLYSVLFV